VDDDAVAVGHLGDVLHPQRDKSSLLGKPPVKIAVFDL
jgi:hypothetical protein